MPKQKIKLSRKEILISTKKGKIPVIAWVYKDTIAARKDITGNFWTITHVQTGYKLWQESIKYDELREYIKEIYDRINWESGSKEVIKKRLEYWRDKTNEQS